MTNLPANDPVIRLLAQAMAQPHAVAVIDGARQISYGDFAARVKQLAAALLAKSGDSAAKVLIDAPQGTEAYQSIFAVLMAGGSYSILNPQWPDARQRLVVEQYQPDIILTPNTQKWRGHAHTIDLMAPLPVVMSEPQWGENAYVLFTSGTTGIPKGVEISRNSLIHFLDWVADAIAYAPGDRASQHPNLAFDLSVVDTYGALCGGATLIPFTSPAMRSMPARTIREQRITVWNSVPSLIDLMQAAGQCTPHYLSGLRFANFCGEPFYARQAKLLRIAAPDAVIQNTYGPTEATVSCTALIVTDASIASDEAVLSLGDSIAGMYVMIEGEEPGEIIIAGPQVAQGYHGDSKATVASFLTREINGAKMPAYRTGDLGSYKNGQLYTHGRIDRQVKISGYRVELAEVEAAIVDIAGLPCYVLLHKGRLTAILESTALPMPDTLIREQAARILPGYAVPGIILAVPLLPRSHNDKIDIAALTTLLDSTV